MGIPKLQGDEDLQAADLQRQTDHLKELFDEVLAGQPMNIGLLTSALLDAYHIIFANIKDIGGCWPPDVG